MIFLSVESQCDIMSKEIQIIHWLFLVIVMVCLETDVVADIQFHYNHPAECVICGIAIILRYVMLCCLIFLAKYYQIGQDI